MRLIDADALLDKLKLYVNGSVIGMIEQAPTIDAVPLDQCKECKNLLLPFKGRSTNPCVGGIMIFVPTEKGEGDETD